MNIFSITLLQSKLLKGALSRGPQKLLFALFFVMAAGIQAQNSGNAGPLQWQYDKETKKLTISGQGAIPDYEEDAQPWAPFAREIKTAEVGEGVTMIGDNAFTYSLKMEKISLPKTLTEIGYHAFYSCQKLASVSIPATVKKIGDRAFQECFELKEIEVDENNANYSSLDGVLYNKKETLLIRYPAGKDEDFTVPNTVTTIGDDAFSDCEALLHVTIPNSVTRIGDYAFYKCVGLEEISIPASVTSIGDGALAGCSSLMGIVVDDKNSTYTSDEGILYSKDKTRLIQYPAGKDETDILVPEGVKVIGIGAFVSTINLKNVILPDGLTTIEEDAFADGEALQTVVIPASVTRIGNRAFFASEELLTAKIPEGIERIGDDVFNSCKAMTSIIIPQSLKSIGRSAFEYCVSLGSITLPAGVTSIGPKAFEGCFLLKTLVAQMPDPDRVMLGDDVFRHVPKDNTKNTFCQLYVPEGSKQKYEAAAQWKDFAPNILEGLPLGIRPLENERPMRKSGIYRLDGVRCQGSLQQLPTGIYIVNGKKVAKK